MISLDEKVGTAAAAKTGELEAAGGKSRRRRVVGVQLVAFALGLALFVYVVNRVGVQSIFDTLTRIGLGFFVLLVISGSVLLVLGGLLYAFRKDASARFFVDHFFPWSWVQNTLWSLSDSPMMLCLAGTGIIAGLLILIAILVRFAAMFVKGRIHLSDTMNVVVWSCVPAIFLLPFGMIVTRLDRNETLGITALWVIVVLCAWIYYRLLKGVAVLFDIYPTRVYLYAGLATAVLLVATVLHMDYHHNWLEHLETFNRMRGQ